MVFPPQHLDLQCAVHCPQRRREGAQGNRQESLGGPQCVLQHHTVAVTGSAHPELAPQQKTKMHSVRSTQCAARSTQHAAHLPLERLRHGMPALAGPGVEHVCR